MIDLTKPIDLSTTYLGLKLKNPLVASSSPMCREVGNIRRLEDAGASAIVLHSLFELNTLHSHADFHAVVHRPAILDHRQIERCRLPLDPGIGFHRPVAQRRADERIQSQRPKILPTQTN